MLQYLTEDITIVVISSYNFFVNQFSFFIHFYSVWFYTSVVIVSNKRLLKTVSNMYPTSLFQICVEMSEVCPKWMSPNLAATITRHFFVKIGNSIFKIFSLRVFSKSFQFGFRVFLWITLCRVLYLANLIQWFYLFISMFLRVVIIMDFHHIVLQIMCIFSQVRCILLIIFVFFVGDTF